jgi:tRNA A37 threonylcarbamoyltransferase TsaD
MYAPQEALIPSPKDANAVLTFLFDELEQADVIIPGGVAENFCLDEWVRSNIREFLRRGKDDIIKRLHFNRDFTAPIQFPGYEDLLRAQYAYYAQNGVVFEGNNPYAV